MEATVKFRLAEDWPQADGTAIASGTVVDGRLPPATAVPLDAQAHHFMTQHYPHRPIRPPTKENADE